MVYKFQERNPGPQTNQGICDQFPILLGKNKRDQPQNKYPITP